MRSRILSVLFVLLGIFSLLIVIYHNEEKIPEESLIVPQTPLNKAQSPSLPQTNFIIEVPLDQVKHTSLEKKIGDDLSLSVLMVESRPDPRITPVLGQCSTLLENIPLLLIHGVNNEEFVKKQPLLMSLRSQGRLRLRCLFGCGSNNVVGGGASYSELLFRVDFWQGLTSSHILIVQTDSWLCPPSHGATSLLQRLKQLALKYDFIGAPDSPNHFNGGFSLRNRSAMLLALKQLPPPQGYHAEDVYFSRALALLSASSSTNIDINEYKENFISSLILQMQSKGILTPELMRIYTQLSNHSQVRGRNYQLALSALRDHPNGLKLQPYTFHSERVPSYHIALEFALRSGEGKGGHSSWGRETDEKFPLPIGVHLSEGARNPKPSPFLVEKCIGLGAILRSSS